MKSELELLSIKVTITLVLFGMISSSWRQMELLHNCGGLGNFWGDWGGDVAFVQLGGGREAGVLEEDLEGLILSLKCR